MTSFKKMISILDLFTEKHPTWTIEKINDTLGLNQATGYRYVRELCDVGLLARLTGGAYILGPKIIELDYRIRLSDPVIFNGIPVMKDLLHLTGCDVLLGNMYNDEILMIHEEQPSEAFPNRSIGRGKPFPLFKGSVSKIIIAHLPRSRQQKLYEKYATGDYGNELGNNWEEFRSKLSYYRKNGYVIAPGEVDEDKTSISAPIFSLNQIRGAISLGMPSERYHLFDESKLVDLVVNAAKKISQLIEDQEEQQ